MISTENLLVNVFLDSMQAVAEIAAERRKRFKRRMGDGGLVYPRV